MMSETIMNSREEFDRILGLFGVYSRKLLEYFKEEDRLKNIIESWNLEVEEIEELEELRKARIYSWKLRFIRRSVLTEFPGLTLPEVKSSSGLIEKINRLKSLSMETNDNGGSVCEDGSYK